VTDEELMDRVVAGDQGAFTVLYGRYRETVADHLWRLCGDAELVADAVSETFIRVWRRARTFSVARGGFRPWLLTVAANTLRTLWKRERTPTTPLTDDNLPDGDARSDDQVVHALALRAVWPRLSLEHREALSLRFFSGFSYEEIATVQRVPAATARTRVFYGLKKLRSLLEV
jgi:RNA polymerase sigma factor (sigma-70 family)